MESPESYERFSEGMLRAASCCREFAVMLDAQEWRDLSHQLLTMLNKGRAMYKSSPLTEEQVLNLVTQMEVAQRMARSISHAVH